MNLLALPRKIGKRHTRWRPSAVCSRRVLGILPQTDADSIRTAAVEVAVLFGRA